MLEVLVLTLTVMQEEASTFGLQINWSKSKILHVPSSSSTSTVQVADGHVVVVDAFVYLGCLIDSSGDSRGEVLHWIVCIHDKDLHLTCSMLLHLPCKIRKCKNVTKFSH